MEEEGGVSQGQEGVDRIKERESKKGEYRVNRMEQCTPEEQIQSVSYLTHTHMQTHTHNHTESPSLSSRPAQSHWELQMQLV